MRKLFYLLIATLVLVSCGNGSKKKTGENQAEEIQSNRIEVLYFMERNGVSLAGR